MAQNRDSVKAVPPTILMVGHADGYSEDPNVQALPPLFVFEVPLGERAAVTRW